MALAKIVFLTVAGFIFGPAAEEAYAASELHLRDDASGGDCYLAGTWDQSSRTCTLTADFNGKFIVDSDNITLDGDGYTMIGEGQEDPAQFQWGSDGGGFGVYVYRRSGVTIRDLALTRYDYGVNLVESNNITVTGISTTLSGMAGISLHTASNNFLTNNTIQDVGGLNTGICIGFASNNNTVTGNTLIAAARGIYLHTNCTGNIISGNNLIDNLWGLTLFEADISNLLQDNTISGSEYGIHINDRSNATVRYNTIRDSAIGLFLKNVAGSTIYQNSFLDNTKQAVVWGSGVNAFSLPLPDGGNFWSNYDSAPEGCADIDGNGICDEAYTFSGGSDQYAWLNDDGWVCGRPLLGLSVQESYWGSYSDYISRLLSIEWKITNSGANNAHDVEVSGSPCSNGVMTVSTCPDDVGTVAAGSSREITFLYMVPQGVASFRSSLFLHTGDLCGSVHNYPQSGSAGP